MLNIIWSSLWFVGWSVLAIFYPRLSKWELERRRRKTGKYTPNPSWRDRNLNRVIRVTFAFIAFKSAFSLLISVFQISGLGIEQQVVGIWIEHIYPFIYLIYPIVLLVMVVFASYFGLKNMYYSDYAPILVSNLTDQPLTIYIREKRIGIIKPGKSTRNGIIVFNTSNNKYPVKARDQTGNIIFSHEFESQELDSIDWRVTIQKSDVKV